MGPVLPIGTQRDQGRNNCEPRIGGPLCGLFFTLHYAHLYMYARTGVRDTADTFFF